MPPIEQKQELVAARATPMHTVSPRKQRRQMLIALAILLLALILLLIKDWRLLFPVAPPATSMAEPLERSIQPSSAQPSAKSQTAHVASSIPTKTKSVAIPPAAKADAPAIVTSDRAVLPPLEVEVVAGSRHRTVPPASNSVNVDLQSETAAPQTASPSAQTPAIVVNASESMHLSPDTAQVVSRPVEPNYPLLAKQMKVQGSVVLQALIDRSGGIEDLRVLSGPAILSSAAVQAVKQWHFKPYYLSGQPVETQARITVNFTISTN
jgi:TonB family protein